MTNAKNTIAKLNAWREAADTNKIAIGWRWVGRSRDGVITAYKDGKAIYEVVYHRNTQAWKDNDFSINSLRTGSNKHKALEELASKLNA